MSRKRRWRFLPEEWIRGWLAIVVVFSFLWVGEAFGGILVPMDDVQTDHLRAYGLAYWSLQQGWQLEWLLNYRGGSFLLEDRQELERKARLLGVLTEPVTDSQVLEIRGVIEENNMESVRLEVAPKVAI